MNRNILRLLPLLLLMTLALASVSSCGNGKQQQDTTAWDYKAPPAMPINRAITGDSMGFIADAEIHRLPTYIEHIGVARVNPYQWPVDVPCVGQAGHGLEAVLLGSNELQGVGVVEDFLALVRPIVQELW